MALNLWNQVYPKYDFYEKATKSLEGRGLSHEMGGVLVGNFELNLH